MYIKVRVRAGAKKESFVVASSDHFEISVKEPAEENRANKRVIELVAKHFQIPTAKVRIKSGHHAPSKMLTISV